MLPLTVTIPIVEKHIELSKQSIAKNSEDVEFVKEIVASFLEVDTLTILNINDLEEAVSKFEHIVDHAWFKFLKLIRITRQSKSWWNDKCSQDLVKYHSSRTVENWKAFQKTIKITKRKFKKLLTKSMDHRSL